MSKNLVVVLGMHRSGTSLVAKSLEVVNYSLGDRLMPAQDDNPKGFWEDIDIVAFNDELLAVCFAHWDRPGSLMLSQQLNLLAEYQARACDLLAGKLLQAEQLAIKDPRMCLLLPFWEQVFLTLDLNVKYLFVYRNPIDVANSLSTRNNTDLSYGVSLWLFYCKTALDSLAKGCLIVDYQSMLHSPVESINAIASYLNVDSINQQALCDYTEKYIDESLCHSATAVIDLDSSNLINQITASYAEIIEANTLKLFFPISELSDINQEIETAKFNYEVLVQQAARDFYTIQSLKNTELEFHGRIQQMDDQLRQMDDQLSQMDDQLRQMDDQLRQKDDQLRQMDDQLRQKDDQLSEANNHVSQQSLVIENQKDLLVQRALWIEALQQDIDEKTKQVASYQRLYDDVLASVSYRLSRLLTYPIRKPLVSIVIPKLQSSPRLSAVVTLLRHCLASPLRAISLLNYSRIKNLFNLIFKRRDLVMQVTNNYSQLLSATKPDSIKKIDNEDYSNFSLTFIPQSSPRVSVIIPVYNQVSYTIACLRSIRDRLPKATMEIIVADDCSNDQTEELMGSVKGIKYIRHAENLGFLRSCNRAAEHAAGEFIFLLNNDTTVKAGWLDRLVEVFDARADAGLVGSKLVYPDGWLQEAGGIIWDDASGWNYGRLDDAEKSEYSYLKEVDYVSGAAIMFRRDFFADLNGFDERYIPAYYEDVDLAFEVRKAGKKVFLQPESVITHFEGVSNGVDTNAGIKKHQVINQQRFFEKWEPQLTQEHYANAENVFLARDRAKNKTTVLVIDHYVPHFDQDAGSKSTYLYLQLLVSEGFNVKFLGDNFFKHEPYTSVIQQMGVEVLYGEFYSKNWKQWLSEHAQDIDVIYMIRPHIAEKYIDFINQLKNRPKTIYFGCDLHYLRIQRQYEVEGRKSLLSDAKAWQSREEALFQKVDQIYYPSIVEVDEIKKNFPDLAIKAIPLYVFDEILDSKDHSATVDLLFVGGFNHQPNEDGLIWFCNKVFPLVRNKIPEVRLNVVGSCMPESISMLACNNIIIHGFLPDEKLTELYEHVRMTVVPLRFGAGIKGKVLEAMYRGLPVVATSVGAEGIPESEDCMVVRDSASDFAESLVEYYKNEESLSDLSKKTQAVMSKYFSRDAALQIVKSDFSYRNERQI